LACFDGDYYAQDDDEKVCDVHPNCRDDQGFDAGLSSLDVRGDDGPPSRHDVLGGGGVVVCDHLPLNCHDGVHDRVCVEDEDDGGDEDDEDDVVDEDDEDGG